MLKILSVQTRVYVSQHMSEHMFEHMTPLITATLKYICIQPAWTSMLWAHGPACSGCAAQQSLHLQLAGAAFAAGGMHMLGHVPSVFTSLACKGCALPRAAVKAVTCLPH